jgi:hypothetical protein
VALLTAAQARVYLPAITGTAQDTTIETLILSIGEAFALRCGYPPASVGVAATMESTSYTLRFAGRGGRDLTLPVWPVTAVASVYDDPTDLDHAAASLVASSDYSLRQDGARSYLHLSATSVLGTWSKDVEGAIKCSFTAGFTTVPAKLQSLAGEALADLYRRRQGALSAQATNGPRGGGVSWRDPEDLPPSIARALVATYGLPNRLVA